MYRDTTAGESESSAKARAAAVEEAIDRTKRGIRYKAGVTSRDVHRVMIRRLGQKA